MDKTRIAEILRKRQRALNFTLDAQSEARRAGLDRLVDHFGRIAHQLLSVTDDIIKDYADNDVLL